MKTGDKIAVGKPVIMDGSMGAILMQNGITPDKILCANIENGDVVTAVHKGYIEAGSDIILTNTFDLTEATISRLPYSAEEIVSSALKCAQNASRGKADIAFDVSPSGYMARNTNEFPKEKAYNLYKKLITLAKNDADLLMIESISLLDDIEVFCEAAHDVCDLPIFASMTFTSVGKSWFGCDINDWFEAANKLNITAAGLNCTMTPQEMLPWIKQMKDKVNVPVFAKPNRGQPELKDGNTFYGMSTEEFAAGIFDIYNSGINIVGGCCGSDKECIARIKKLVC